MSDQATQELVTTAGESMPIPSQSEGTDVLSSRETILNREERSILDKIQSGAGLGEIAEDTDVSESPDTAHSAFTRMNKNIVTLRDRIAQGEGNVGEARKILENLLKAREVFYLTVVPI